MVGILISEFVHVCVMYIHNLGLLTTTLLLYYGLQKVIIPFPTLISIKKELSVKHKEKGKKKRIFCSDITFRMSLSIETLWADIQVISSFRRRQPLDRLGQMSMTPNSGLDMFFMPVLHQETSVLAPPEGYCFKSPELYLITHVKMVIFRQELNAALPTQPCLEL